MVIEYSVVSLNFVHCYKVLYIACSYQPEMSVDILHWKFSRANILSCNWNIITILVSTPLFSGLTIQMKKKLEHYFGEFE